VFARLREQRCLNRFHRRGLAAVIREFALHALACSLGRAVTLLQGICVSLLTWSLLIKYVQSYRYTFGRTICLEYAAIRLLDG